MASVSTEDTILWAPRPQGLRRRSRSRPRDRGDLNASSGFRGRHSRRLRDESVVSENTTTPTSSVRSQSIATPPDDRLLFHDSIRLLDIKRRTREGMVNGKITRFLDCRLSASRLSEAGRSYKYNALSYHWGSVQGQHHILCNGRVTQVSSTLHEALSQYRKSNLNKPLWVDALCINQDNIRERNHQVHLMTDIYELADLVIVWLDSCDPQVELAFERLARGRPPWEKTDVLCETKLSSGGEERVILGRGQPCKARVVQSQIEKGLIKLFRKPWFERCWVFQEILLAERAVLWCGPLEMSWSSFVRHCEELEDGKESMNPLIFTLCSDFVLKVQDLRDRFRSGSHQALPPLSKILIDTWQRKASDDRDKIFSVLGLVEGTVLKADYALTVRDTYMAAARACILQDRHLGILCLTELAQTESELTLDQTKLGLPSWVPHWGAPGKHTRLPGNSSIPDFGHLSRSQTARQRLLRNSDELALQGVAIGYLEKPERRLVSMEVRPFIRCAPYQTDQSLALDKMLRIERPDERDQVTDLIASMSYYYKTGACRCMESPTYCAAEVGIPCKLSSTASSELPAQSAPGDWVCAVRGGTGLLVLRPRLQESHNPSMPRCVFTLIGVTSYTLTGSILMALGSEQSNGARSARSDVSNATSLSYDCIFRAMEIIVA